MIDDQWALLNLSAFSLSAIVYLIVRSVVDWRARNTRWAVAGTVIATLGVTAVIAPMQTHAIKIDIPRN
jgi:hypothetical protein